MNFGDPTDPAIEKLLLEQSFIHTSRLYFW